MRKTVPISYWKLLLATFFVGSWFFVHDVSAQKMKPERQKTIKDVLPTEEGGAKDISLKSLSEEARRKYEKKVKPLLDAKTDARSVANGKVIKLDIEPGVSYNLKKLLKQQGIVFGSKSDVFKGRYEYREKRLRDPKTGKVPFGIEEKSLEYVKRNIPGGSPFSGGGLFSTTFAPGDQTSPWVQRGPYNVGGRTRALAFDSRDEDILLAGGVSGGMWRSTDQGANWTRVTALTDHPSVTDIEQDPTNPDVWYYSTGERFGNSASGGGAFFIGDGIFKSTDNGVTWAQLPSTRGTQVQFVDNPLELTMELAINPTNGDVYAGTVNGILRSQDGGATWVEVLAGDFLTLGHIEISSTGVLYAGIGNTADAAAGEAGIWRSLTGDAGDWVNISDGVADFPTNFGRVVFGLAPSNENVMYVYTDATTAILRYTYLSGDGSGAGGDWEDRTNLPPFGGSVGGLNSQGGYNMYIRVHPMDQDMVFLGATNIYRSTDGFSTTGNITWVGGYSPANNVSIYPNQHPDNHRLIFLDSDPNIALTGSDGGVSITDDITSNNAGFQPVVWRSLNNGYYTTQPYAISLGPTTQLMAGFQDNSTWFTATNSATDNWTDVFSGDGAYNQFNDDGTVRYVSSQGGNMFRQTYTDANDNTPNSTTGVAPDNGSQFITPFERDPSDDRIMYFAGATGLFRTLDATTAAGATGWSNINSLTDITAIGVSTLPRNIVYVGNGSGTIIRIDDATSATPVSTDVTAGLPAGNISGIEVDPYDAMHVMTVLSNYVIPSVFESWDGGATWTDISGNLEENPDGTGNGPSVQWIELVGYRDVYLVGTSTGVYFTKSINGAATSWTWIPEIGNVPSPQLRSRNTDGLVAVATHGNGIFSANFELSPPPADDLSVSGFDMPASVVANAATAITVEVLNFGSADQSNYDVTLVVDGAVVATESVPTTVTSGDEISYTFTATADLSAVGLHTLTAYTTLPGDVNRSNDTATVTINADPIISSYPYQESFEGTDGFWSSRGSGSSWERGAPANTVINSASDGTEAWVTNLDGDYNAGEESWVESPVFDFTSLINPQLNMDIQYLLEPPFDFFGSTFIFDGVAMQYSTDFGNTWTNLGDLTTGTNWYNGTEVASLGFTGGNGDAWTDQNGSNYQNAEISLAFLAGQPSVKFRVALGSDVSDTEEGFAFDNVRIFEPQFDLAVTGIVAPAAQGFFGATETVTATVKNIGTDPISNPIVRLTVDGSVIVTDNLTVTLNQGDSVNHTFSATADLSAFGDHTISVLGNAAIIDEIPDNNTFTTTVFTEPLYVAPFTDEFEAGGPKEFYQFTSTGDVAWISDQTGGTPSGGTGPFDDHSLFGNTYIFLEASGLNFNAAAGDQATMVTSGVDITALTDPYLSFWYHMFGGGMGDLEVLVTDLDTDITYSVLQIDGAQQTAQGDDYRYAKFPLSLIPNPSLSRVRVTFIATRGNDFRGDIAIDDFNIYDEATSPKVTCPADVAGTTDAGVDFAGLTIPSATGTMTSGFELFTNDYNGTSDASDDYLVGTTPVTFGLTDQTLYDECQFDVVVVDDEAPNPGCPADTTYTTIFDSVYVDYDADVTDNVEIFTYSVDQTLAARGPVMCPSGANGFMRVFDLKGDFKTRSDMVRLTGFQMGIEIAESLTGTQTGVFNLYTYDPATAFDPSNFTLVHTQNVDVTDGLDFMQEVDFDVMVSTSTTIIAELVSPGGFNDAEYFMASSQPVGNRKNNSFDNTALCGGILDLGALGFAGYDWVMNLEVSPEVNRYMIAATSYPNASLWPTNTGSFRLSTSAKDAYNNSSNCEYQVFVNKLPFELDFINVIDTNFTATWTKDEIVDQYEVTIAKDAMFTDLVVSDIPTTDTSYLAMGLEPFTEYWVKIVAKSITYDLTTEVVGKVTTFPSTPINITLDVDQTTADIDFTKSDGFYYADLSQDVFQTVLSTVSMPGSFTGLMSNTAYQTRIRGTRSTDTDDFFEYSDTIYFYTAPDPITNLATSNVTNSSFDIAWDAVSMGTSGTGYTLEIATDAGFTNVVVNQSLTTTSFSATGLNDVTKYWIRVTATNPGQSSSATITQWTAPNTPTALAGTDIGSDIFTSNWTAVNDNGSAMLYEVVLFDMSNTPLDTITTGATSATFSSLSEGGYRYQIRALANKVYSDYSNIITVFTTASPATNLTLITSLVGQTPSVTLNWTPNSAYNTTGGIAISQTIERSVAGTGNWIPIASGLPTAVSTAADPSVTEFVRYAYRIATIVNASGTTAGSISYSNVALSDIVSSDRDGLLEATTTVSPNPSTGVFKLGMTNVYNGELRFTVFDVTGKMVLDASYDKSSQIFETSIDLTTQKSGAYVLRVTSENGFITRRLIKE